MATFDYCSAARQIAEYEKRRPRNTRIQDGGIMLVTIEGPDTAEYYQKQEGFIIPHRHGVSYRNVGLDTK